MIEIEFKVDSKGYEEWVAQVSSRFHRMVKTMKNVAEIIKIETIPRVPLDTSALEQSYDYKVIDRSPFILLSVGFDAVDPKSGFHYAKYQHDHYLHHPKRGEDHYLVNGIQSASGEVFQLIEKDYLSLFGEGNVSAGRTNVDDYLFERFVFFEFKDWMS